MQRLMDVFAPIQWNHSIGISVAKTMVKSLAFPGAPYAIIATANNLKHKGADFLSFWVALYIFCDLCDSV